MKKYNIFNAVLPVLLFGIAAFTGCSKDDGPIKKDVLSQIDAVPAISTTVDLTGSEFITDASPFQGKFSVALYFEGATPPPKVDIAVRKTNGSGVTVKIFKSDVTSLPANFTVSRAEIETLFGAVVVPGDTYDFAPDIYLANGKKIEAFPAGGIGTASGPIAMPGYSEYARFAALCPYDPDFYTGNFAVVKDVWADFSVGAIIALTKIDATHFSFVDPFAIAATPVPIVVTVDPSTNRVSIAKIVIGTGWNYGPPYNTMTPAVSTTGTTKQSFLEPCAARLTLNMAYYIAGDTYAPYQLILKKP